MKVEKIDLYAYFNKERGKANGGYLTCYLRTESKEVKAKKRPAMLVFPGGGYWFLSDREAEPIALAYLNEGYAAFVLTYSVQVAYPLPLNEAIMAMAYIREHAEEFCIFSDKIAATGFSAGGHLLGLLATVNDKEAERILGKKAVDVRPDAVVYNYAVVSFGEYTHKGTRDICTENGKLDRVALSIEKRVDANSAPAFIWHTSLDTCVPVQNAFLLAQAYQKASVGYNLHIFEKGWHGLSLGNAEVSNLNPCDFEVEYVSKWFRLAIEWLQSRDFTVKKVEE